MIFFWQFISQFVKLAKNHNLVLILKQCNVFFQVELNFKQWNDYKFQQILEEYRIFGQNTDLYEMFISSGKSN